MEQAAQAQASTAMIQQLLMGMGALSKAFYERFGNEALPIITELMGRGGEMSGKRMREMAPVKDMKDVAEGFNMLASMMGVKPEVIESSDKVLHFKMPRCPLGVEQTSKELCEAIMTQK